jgi:type I restriction enzyme M protein
MAVKKSDLYSSIWTACDALRGGMDPSQYKDYVLFMLFIKYVTDKYGDSEDLMPAVTIPKGASFHDMVALKGKSDIGDRINKEVVAPLVDQNQSLARSDFPDFDDSNKLGEGRDKVDRLTQLIAIFEKPELNFARNRADQDDLLGDAYEYLMRHFAQDSGKSKGQFYTPSEVSRIMAKVIGITPESTKASTRVYDPTCGSGSLLLKVAAESGKSLTLEGQEKDVTTAGLARMNMILHDFPTARILSGNTLSSPKFKDGEQLRTYDYVVANPPFSDKAWSTGLTLGESGASDPFQRFGWGVPPAKQGDYAYLLHIVRSMKATAKAACILPHGVLFRGNAEAAIRENLIRSGILKGIIGLPANLFYGTGIPACIIVLDKENAVARKGVFMIDASKGFIKDGNKNRLREQDIHKIVDTFTHQADLPRYSRMVPITEIADPKNAYNLNLPRYIDSTEPEDLQDIDAHLRGGIPDRDLDALAAYWKVIPSVRSTLFAAADRPGYSRLTLPIAAVKSAILRHPEFRTFNQSVSQLLATWRSTAEPQLKRFAQGGHPKTLIEAISEALLQTFQTAPLLDAYDIYQHLMDYWAASLQDDCYLIAADGWREAAQPKLIVEERGQKSKAKPDFTLGRKKYLAELVPPALIVRRWHADEHAAMERLEADLAALQQQLEEMAEEHGGEEGLLADAANDKGKLTKASVTARLRDVRHDPEAAEERKVLNDYLALAENEAGTADALAEAQDALTAKVAARYPRLTEGEIKTLVVEDKWLATLAAAVQGELDRVSQTLTTRIRELAERYATPLPQLTDEVAALAARVDEQLKKMGAVWK